MALTKEEKQQKEQERLARVAEERAEAEAETKYRNHIADLRKQRDDEKVKAELARYSFEKMDFFIKAHSIAEEYYALQAQQLAEKKAREQKQQEELIAKMESLMQAADNKTVDQWIKDNSENGEQSLAEVLKNTEESVS